MEPIFKTAAITEGSLRNNGTSLEKFESASWCGTDLAQSDDHESSLMDDQSEMENRSVVRGIADVFHEHRAFLKPVLLLSSTHPEVHRRGSAYSREMGENFTSALRQVVYRIEHEEPAAALQFCFSMVHSAVVMRTMYGAGFAVPPVSQEQFAESLATAASRYLFARPEA